MTTGRLLVCAAGVLARPLAGRVADRVHGRPAGERGSAIATTTAFFDVGFLSAALALGVLAERYGLACGFALAGAVSAAGALLFLPKHHAEHKGAPP